ncbi:MAG: hypothetical protein H6577_13525 [Lewinellaceae bacterium]|nr:hypothetical protein [Saprospiraceae bacterium]MCB9339145.1 hypothetical protein [Lewinellaceae bacterium]
MKPVESDQKAASFLTFGTVLTGEPNRWLSDLKTIKKNQMLVSIAPTARYCAQAFSNLPFAFSAKPKDKQLTGIRVEEI